MASISATQDENQNSLHNAFAAQFCHPKRSDLTLLAEMINNNTSESCSSSSFTTIQQHTTSCTSLKRKRPPKIEIPQQVLQEIPTEKLKFRDKIHEDEGVGFESAGVGVFSIKGKKKVMEDTHKIICDLHGHSKKGFFGVYDGHGGRKAAEFAAENLHGNILEMMEKCKGEMEKEDAIKAGYLKTDQDFLKQGLSSGACCVTALIEGKDIFVSNLGDCRAVLCKGGVAEALTEDHSAKREDERNRILNEGGFVEIHHGTWRVHGILSVSRSIGDVHLKDWVPAEPDTSILHLTPDMEFLVLASDGLWEKVGNQEAVDTAMRVSMVSNELASTGEIWKEAEDEFGCEIISPPSKSQRISLIKKQKLETHSPILTNKLASTVDIWKEDENEIGCENMSPPLKSQRISLIKNQKLEIHPPILINKLASTNDISNEDEDEFGCENTSPPSKSQRTPLIKKQKLETHSPIRKRSSFMTTVNLRKENEEKFGCENSSPSRAKRIPVVSQHKLKTHIPSQESRSSKKKPTSRGLMAACKELVNLAATRGSLDDITVMVIDLKHFSESC